MTRAGMPIPARLNLAIAAVQLLVLCSLLWAAGRLAGYAD